MTIQLNGASRLYFIVGDPIAQVKSPQGVTECFQNSGLNAAVLPAHVSPANLERWFQGIQHTQNLDGIIVTVPHKFAASSLCHKVSARSEFLGAVNVMRRHTDGNWYGDMLDGLGFVNALKANGSNPQGKSVFLVGAGGAGSAIAYALLESGVSGLTISDQDSARRSALLTRLNNATHLLGLPESTIDTINQSPINSQFWVNATPMGMHSADPLPMPCKGIAKAELAGCVITAPDITEFIRQARAAGCSTLTGTQMFHAVRDAMVEFFIEGSNATT